MCVYGGGVGRGLGRGREGRGKEGDRQNVVIRAHVPCICSMACVGLFRQCVFFQKSKPQVPGTSYVGHVYAVKDPDRERNKLNTEVRFDNKHTQYPSHSKI